MKIATWNLERPNYSSKSRNARIVDCLKSIDADIFILTETNAIIHPGEAYTGCATISLHNAIGQYYKPGENRTTIWTKYPLKQRIKTFDALTSICANIRTPLGDLNVYGTIIGIHGNRRNSFNLDLEKQMADWRSICEGGNICIAGDFNISFADNYYYTKAGRQIISDCLKELNIENLTQNVPGNIDHIAISNSFLKSAEYKTEIWNEDKRMSDHIGVCITLGDAKAENRMCLTSNEKV